MAGIIKNAMKQSVPLDTTKNIMATKNGAPPVSPTSARAGIVRQPPVTVNSRYSGVQPKVNQNLGNGKFAIPTADKNKIGIATPDASATAAGPGATGGSPKVKVPTMPKVKPGTPDATIGPPDLNTNPGAGLPDTTAATPAPAIEPKLATLDPKTDTVQGQVESIIAKDSPLMQLHGTRAKQAANSRGLLNSSMAVQAGEAAVIDAAMPMASQDAATFARNRELNQATENEFGLQEMRGRQAKELSEIENANQRLLQANQSASQFMAATSNAIGEILANPDIPANQKDALIARQNELLKNYMAVSGGIMNLNLKKLLTFKSRRNLPGIPAKPGEKEGEDIWGKIHNPFGEAPGQPKDAETKDKVLDPGGWFS